MKRFVVLALWLSSYFGLVSHARAQVFRGPQASALGGAGSAGMPGAEATFLNPALIPLFNGSSLESYYRDGYADLGQHRQAWGFGGIDNTNDVWFPGTLHYLRLRDTGRADLPADGELWHVGLAERFGPLSVGISGYRLTYDLRGQPRYTQWNGSVGAVFMIGEGLGFAYVLRNIAQPGGDVPLSLREDMSQVIGAFASFNEIARLRVDLVRNERFNPDHKMAYLIGLESKWSDLMLFRIGYRYDDLARQRVWTAGLGFDGPRLKIDYAVEKNQERIPGALHSVDLRLVF